MAAILSSAITKLQRYVVADMGSKVQGSRARVSIVLSTQGATAGDITATLLGFKSLSLVFCYRFVSSGEKQLLVSTDGTNVFTFTSVNGAPANVTGTVYLIVEGVPI